MSTKHLLLPALITSLAAQNPPAPPSSPIGAVQRRAVIEALVKELKGKYVFPEIAEKVSGALLAKAGKGGYDGAPTLQAFGDALTKDLQEIGKDRHFRAGYYPGFKPEGNSDRPTKEELEAERKEMASTAFGIGRVERLPGNVGYLEVRGFGRPEIVGRAFSGAISILSGTRALILDLRRNGGGEPEGVAELMSHFFEEGDSRHLNSIFTRPQNATRQYWTNTTASPRYAQPVYVLTSPRTFSGGEECAYDFQTQKRATLVGEVTGGGANPGEMFLLVQDFVVFIPTGRAINPVTNTNWEGVGVKPDIAVPAADALKTAHAAILKDLIPKENDPEERDHLKEILSKVERGVIDPPVYGRH